VSELGFGTWGLGDAGWVGATEDESLRALRHAASLGVNFFDTALAYGSEKVLGRFLADASEDLHIATKIPTKDGRWPARAGIHADEMYPADWIVECTETSLRNLGVETIDLQQLHTWTDEWVDAGEWRSAVDGLKAAGKIRYFGISINNHEPDNAVRLVESGAVDVVQVIYNIFDQSPESELFPAVTARDVGVIARVPFDEGGLTGTVRPDSSFPEGDFRNQYFSGTRKHEVWDRVRAITTSLGVPVDELPDIALRFCLSNVAVGTVIAGMRSPANVDRNARSVERGPLEAEQLEALRAFQWTRDFYADFYR